MTPLSILLVLISALLHSSWNFFTKRGNWPIEFFVWVFFWGTVLYLPLFVGFGVFPSFLLQPPARLWWAVLLSGFFQTIYVICLIEAYREGDLSIVYPISRSAPLFTQLWAVLFIGEILSLGGVLGIALVMIAMFIISWKDFHFQSIVPCAGQFTSRPYLLALTAAITGSIYAVFDKVGVQLLHPVFYIWLINFGMCLYTGLYSILYKKGSFLRVWQESKKEIFIIAILQNVAYLLVLFALQMSKVSYVVAFRQVGALFGTGMGILLLKEGYGRTRMIGVLILTLGLILIGLSK